MKKKRIDIETIDLVLRWTLANAKHLDPDVSGYYIEKEVQDCFEFLVMHESDETNKITIDAILDEWRKTR